MRVTSDKAVNGLKRYLSSEVSKISDPVRKFGYIFAINSMDTKKTVELAQRMGLWGLFDSEGCLDTADVRKGLEGAFTSVPELDILCLKFTRADVNNLIQFMEQ